MVIRIEAITINSAVALAGDLPSCPGFHFHTLFGQMMDVQAWSNAALSDDESATTSHAEWHHDVLGSARYL